MFGKYDPILDLTVWILFKQIILIRVGIFLKSHLKWLNANFLSLLSEFYFEVYISQIMNMKREIIHLLFELGHNYVSWQCSATCWKMTRTEAHWLGIWDFATSTTFFWSLTHWLPFSQESAHFFMPKNFLFQRRSRNCI